MINLELRKGLKFFDKTKVFVSVVIIAGAILFLFQEEIFKKKSVYYVDNATIRTMFQSQLQKQILEEKIKDKDQITNLVINFDNDLDEAILSITKKFNVEIHASRAFYSNAEKVDLTSAILQNLEERGYVFK